MFVSIDILCPVLTLFSTINPSLVILCFYHEYTVYRNDNMVNLRGTFIFSPAFPLDGLRKKHNRIRIIRISMMATTFISY